MDSNDADQLRLLSIFHYVFAGLTALASCLGLLYVVFGALLAAGSMENPPPGPPRAVGWIVAGFGCAFVALGWTVAGLLVAAGRSLSQRRRHTLCAVVAGISCLAFPLGTVLGVLTLIVLMRPSVKASFA